MTITARRVEQLLERLPEKEPGVVFVAMLTPSHAVDLFLEDLGGKSRSRTGRSVASYRRVLDHFTDTLGRRVDVTEITADHVRAFFQNYPHLSINTRSTYDAYLRSFFKWLVIGNRLRRNPMDDIPKPRRVDPMDLDVTTVDKTDVPRLLAACDTWSEILAVNLALYTGARRSALSQLRWRDYNQTRETLTFYEKGGKAIAKPVAAELRTVIQGAFEMGLYTSPDDYLIPNDGPRPTDAEGERDARVIWRIVKEVGRKAGVEVHVHALRAAFATFYLETHPGDLVGLQQLLGHSSLEVTRVYLRKLDRLQAMEPVRDLSWASVAPSEYGAVAAFPQSAGIAKASSAGMGAGGFEPPSPDSLGAERPGRQPGGSRP